MSSLKTRYNENRNDKYNFNHKKYNDEYNDKYIDKYNYYLQYNKYNDEDH